MLKTMMIKLPKITITTHTLNPLANKENASFILEIKIKTRNVAYLTSGRCNVHRYFFIQPHFNMV